MGGRIRFTAYPKEPPGVKHPVRSILAFPQLPAALLGATIDLAGRPVTDLRYRFPEGCHPTSIPPITGSMLASLRMPDSARGRFTPLGHRASFALSRDTRSGRPVLHHSRATERIRYHFAPCNPRGVSPNTLRSPGAGVACSVRCPCYLVRADRCYTVHGRPSVLGIFTARCSGVPSGRP